MVSIRTTWRLAGAAILWLAMIGDADAGIVNVQSALSTKADDGLSGSITGSVDWRTGNRERLITSVAPAARYRSGDHLLLGIGSLELFSVGGSEFDVRTFEHLRYRYTVSDRIVGEVFTQHEFDERKGLDARALLGVGPKIKLLDHERVQLALGVAYMVEYEKLDQEGLADDEDPDVLNHRLSSYLTGSYETAEKLQLVQTVYAQPVLNRPGDIRLLSESQLVIKISRSLSLKSTFVLAYDSEPPDYEEDDDDIDGLDTALKTSITYEF